MKTYLIDWSSAKLGDICEAITDGAHNSPKDCPGGLPMASVKNMTRWGINTSNARTISKQDFERLVAEGCSPILGDVLLAKDGSSCIETVCEFKQQDRIVLLSSIAILRPSKNIYSGYLKYYLDSPDTKALLKAGYVSGSAIPRIVLKDLKRVPIPVPPLPEQKAIAHILGTLDDKIEINQQMNRNLEAISQAIFKSWFVDFDPVRAKMEGRQPVGMDTATAALFPDSFEKSLLGEIPKGWEIKPLDRVANFLNGLALQKYPPIDDYLPAIKIAELRRGVTESSGRASSNIKAEYVVEDGDILFSWSGSLEVCIWCGGRGALNQHLFKVTSADYPKWFYYQWVKYYLPNFQAIAASKATTMGHIQRHHLSEAQVLVPPADTLQTMDKKMTPLLNRIVSNSLESRALRAIRNTLLPKLMSGEIRVKEAEKVLEDVA